MASAYLKTVQAVFRKRAACQIYESAQILSAPGADRTELVLTSTIRDLSRNVKRRIRSHTSFRVSPAGAVEDLSEWSSEEKDDVIMSVAHERSIGETISFRAYEGKNGSDKKLFVERWSKSSVLDSVEVTAFHGDFYTDDTFAALSFHPTISSRISYVAEKKKPKDETYTKFIYEDDWGEQLANKSSPVVVVLDFAGGLQHQKTPEQNPPTSQDDAEDDSPYTDDVKGKVVVMTPPENFACGQVVFAPEEGKLAWTGMETSPRRYGTVYCPNRRSSVWISNYDGSECRNLTPKFEHARSPRFGNDGNMYFLTNKLGGAHHHCSAIHRLNLENGNTSSVVPEVKKPTAEKFCGIYAIRLPHIQDTSILLTSHVRSTTRALEFELQSGDSLAKLTDLVDDAPPEQSWAILGSGKGQVVLVRYSADGEVELQHKKLRENRRTAFLRKPASSAVIQLPQIIKYPTRPTLESILNLPKSTENTLFASKSSNLPPCIIIPHGGPHTGARTWFEPYTACFVELGIAVLSVNYTGSLGFGQDSIDDLCGKIGTTDVQDVQHARDELAKSGLVDGERIAVVGGSHGGFLAAWLVGAYPDAYKCAVLRNPVINLGACLAASDISDWACAEAGISYDFNSPPLITPDIYEKLWKASPMSVADKVKVPVLVALGGKDRRVPPYEGKNWMEYLKGQGNENVRAFKYPDDGHSLDSAEAFKHGFEAIALFLKEFL